MIERKQLKGLLQRYRVLLEHYLELKSIHEIWLKIIKTLEQTLQNYIDPTEEISLTDPKLREAVSYTQKKILSTKKTLIPFLHKQGNTLKNRIVTFNNLVTAMNEQINQLHETLQNTDLNGTELLIETPLLDEQYHILKFSHELNWQKDNDLHEIKQLQAILQPFINLNISGYETKELKKKLEKNSELQNIYQILIEIEFTSVKIQETYIQVLESWKLAEELARELAVELNLEKQLKDELELKLQLQQSSNLTPLPMTPSLAPGNRTKGEKDKE